MFKLLVGLIATLNSPFWRGLAVLLSMTAAAAGLAFTLTRWGLAGTLWWTAVLVVTVLGLLLLLVLAGLFVRVLGKGKRTETLGGIANVLVILVIVGGALWVVLGLPWPAPLALPDGEFGVVTFPAGHAKECPGQRAQCGPCCDGTCGGRCRHPGP